MALNAMKTAASGPAWFIDAWSPPDGLVFASKRRQRDDPWGLSSVDAEAEDKITTFAIAAPGFEAYPVARSMAFGATRRGFQERFSLVENAEFGFESLDELVRFARRIYLGSGPGTAGGEGVDPPEPGPRPSDGGAPSSDLLEYFQIKAASGDEERASLDKMWDAMSREQRLEEIVGAISATTLIGAAKLLVASASESWSAGNDGQRRNHLLNTAAFLADSAGRFDDFLEYLDVRSTEASMRQKMSWHRYRYRYEWQTSHEYVKTPLAVASSAAFASGLAKVLRLPASVRTMLDVMRYVAANRLYAIRSDPATLLVLLVAVAANFGSRFHCLHEAPNDYAHRECARFIVDWLPFEQLTPALEEEIHDWCWRGPRDQRNPWLP